MSTETNVLVDRSEALNYPSSVLIAEDEDILREHLVCIAEQAGLNVLAAVSDGEQAVKLAGRHRPDLVILDIRMPNLNGLEAAGALWKSMNIPVLLISAYSQPDYLRESQRLDVFGYLLKPITLESLRVGIAMAWSNYQQQVAFREKLAKAKNALADRVMIERAKGVLMEKLGISESDAMKSLHKKARDSRRPIADLARAILEADDLFGTAVVPPARTKSPFDE